MDQNKLKKGCLIAVGAYILFAVLFYLIGGDQLRFREEQTDMLKQTQTVGEITSDVVVEQRIRPGGDQLTGITLSGETYGRENTGSLLIEVYADGGRAADGSVELTGLSDPFEVFVPLDVELGKAKDMTLRITSPEGAPGNAVTLHFGNTVQATRVEITASLAEEDCAIINGERLDGALCMRLHTRQSLWFGEYYWLFAAVLLAVLCAYCAVLLKKNKKGENTYVLRLVSAFTRYSFLIKQLVGRDFKTKYKRSVLGVLWSFLNPLLTMSVQYIVFSTLFRSSIPNFALYLLTGIVCFSFFSESTSMALNSIVGNASLITKVYVPKYIYPLTRVLSSMVNLLLSLIPLFAIVLITRTPIRPAILLLPVGIVCLFAFCLGMGMLLASSMVFFRDTQFLWGVFTMLWMYATPIFYPESIIPAKLLPLFKCNPLYHVIRFLRILLMEGVSPEPKAYGMMILMSFIPLLIGVLVFKKTQDRFVLNI